MRYTAMIAASLLAASAHAQSPHPQNASDGVLARGDFDGDGRDDTIEVIPVASVATTMALPYDFRKNPAAAEQVVAHYRASKNAAVYARLAANPEHPYGLMGVSNVDGSLKIEIIPSGHQSIGQADLQLAHAAVMMTDGSLPPQISWWSEDRQDFMESWPKGGAPIMKPAPARKN